MFVASPQRLGRYSKAPAVLITGVIVITLLARLGSAQSSSSDTIITIGKDGTATIIGTVQENVKRCTVDLSCYLRLKFQDYDVKVVYVTGEGARCINEEASNRGLAVKKDQRIEAHGQYHREGKLHIISTCPSNSFYIKVLASSGQGQ